MSLDPADYQFISEVLERGSGLQLGPDKLYLLESRLESIWKELGLSGLSELIARLRDTPDLALETRINHALTTNESLFFRDDVPFQFLREQILPELLDRREAVKRLRIWSMACSTGQEPYSIVIALKEYPKFLADWDIEILATDLSEPVLARAKDGVYTDFETQRGLPEELRKRYFQAHPMGWEVLPELRPWIRFEQMNLIHPFGELGTFDLVFCRNILIYFNPELKSLILSRICEVLARDGYLFLGGSETTLGLSDRFERVESSGTAIFRRS